MKLIGTAVYRCPKCENDMDLYEGDLGKVLNCSACEHVIRPPTSGIIMKRQPIK